jgi:membrane carboxypeptidase/penicillin-binding protein
LEKESKPPYLEYGGFHDIQVSSLNVPAVKTLQEVGIENTIDLVHKLGITSLSDPHQYDLSIALGGGQVSLLELSTACASFADNGYFSGYEAMHNVIGLTGAAPIWHEVMRGLLQGRPDHPFERPDGLTQVEVCELSGLLSTSVCPHTRTEWFSAGTEPT